MAFLAQNSNSTDDFGLFRHIEKIPRGTGNQKCRPSTVAKHCAMWGISIHADFRPMGFKLSPCGSRWFG